MDAILFPSPIGDCLSITNQDKHDEGDRRVSVPYRGLLIYNLAILVLTIGILVSVPYRGLLIYNTKWE